MDERQARIDPERFLGRIEAFARIGGTRRGGVNRQALSPEDRAARAELAGLAQARGFALFQDAMANLFVRREGREPDHPPLLIGSHLDSQPTGGRFDGALGTLAAFEVLEALEDSGCETSVSVEMVAWTNEEGSRYAPGAMGSMAFAQGALGAGWPEQEDAAGIRLGDELAATLAALPQARMRPLGTDAAGYFELHIEQGPSLEKERLAIGIVEGIQGTRWFEIVYEGQAGHAGTTALAYRRDPMRAAAAAIAELDAEIMPADERARLTVGRIGVSPGSINAIAERVVFSVDLRHPDPAALDAWEERLRAICTQAAAAKDCAVAVTRIFEMAPSAFAPSMVACVERAAARLGLPARRMISGAFHDAFYVAKRAPCAMLFVPCRDGLSHNEAEYATPADCVNGAGALLASVEEWMAAQT